MTVDQNKVMVTVIVKQKVIVNVKLPLIVRIGGLLRLLLRKRRKI